MVERFRASVWRMIAVLAMLAGVAVPGMIARDVAAQEFGLPVRVYACDAEVSIPSSASGMPIPDECRELPGVRVTAYTEDGEQLASCVTGTDAGGFGEGVCQLDLGPNGLRVYEQETANIPDGYRAEANVRRIFTYTEFAEIIFVNYREDVLPEQEGDGATLRVHSRVCPAHYEGDSFFEDCHESLPERSHWVFADGTYAGTGSDGNAILRELPAGETHVYAGQNEGTGDVNFYCSETADLEARRETHTDVVIEIDDSRHLRGTLMLEPGDDITCDWYVIPGLDRSLWNEVEHWMDDDPAVTYPGRSGDIRLTLYRCPDAYAGTTPAADCTEPEDFALVRATGSNGRQYAVATTNNAGGALLSLSGIPVADFWITLDGHASVARDQFRCETSPGDPASIVQTVAWEADRWTVTSFGDDPNGIACAWYLVPTG